MHNQIHLTPPGVADALLRNQTTEIINPFLRYIEGWQLRASYLRAQLSVHTRGSEESALAEKRLGELRREIVSNRNFLAAEAIRLPPDDRLDATLDELDVLLRSISRAAVSAS